jgi:hypothetical protein
MSDFKFKQTMKCTKTCNKIIKVLYRKTPEQSPRAGKKVEHLFVIAFLDNVPVGLDAYMTSNSVSQA